LLEAQWREANESGKPPRHIYRLTRAGLVFAREQAVPAHKKTGVLLGAKA
jgi:DNA-binding PadR family transcriptional regulator